MVEVFSHDPVAQARLRAVLEAPSLYDEFLLHLHRQGHAVPAQCIARDWSQPHVFTPALVPVLAPIYRDTQTHWQAYQLCEQLIDVEVSFQLWRFRHMKTVERIIGHRRGTGGSSGVGFLKQALELSFFPELIALRSELA
jgi:tryptophan 2,3-dioxygenase